MKKKLIGVILFATIILAGCGNRSVIDTKYTFTKAKIVLGNEIIDVEVSQWRDYEDSDQIQIIDKNGKVYLTHISNVLLTDK
jgi:major membrane immunogen (membrane-anchored lipoprotein)